MRLEKIHVVQFFLYEAQTIEPGRMSAFFGPNGSGKSALIDAVQIAIFGANSNYVSLNAKADDGKGSKRSIRAYCLGQHGELAEQRARDQACTYITLVWRDTETGKPVSTGVCIEASADEPTHNVRGAYVADNVELTLGDHLSGETAGDQRPRDWAAFRDDLRRRTAQASEYQDEVIYETSERYLRAALTRLSNGKDASSIALFRRALRFGLRLRFDRAVDETLRYEVLEERPTNVEAFRSILEQVRKLRELADHVECKLAGAKDVEAKYRAAEQADRRAQSWRIIALDVESDAAQTALQDSYTALERAQGELEAARAAESHAQQDERRLNAECTALRLRQTQHAAHGQHAALTETLQEYERQSADAIERSRKVRLELRVPLLEAAGLPPLETLQPRLEAAAEALTSTPQDDPSALRAAAEDAAKCAKDAWNMLAPVVGQSNRQIDELEAGIAAASDQLEKAKTGKARLPHGVMNLRTYLGHHGIDARPVCEGATIRDERWQRAVEALLGHRVLTALIVDESDEQKAFDLYRKAPKDCSGRLVYPSRMESRGKPKPGTVAALIEGSDALAVSYLRSVRFNVECVDSFEEARRASSALTADGMYASGATVERLSLPQKYELLLVGSAGGAVEALEARLRELKLNLTDAQRRARPLQAAFERLRLVPAFDSLWEMIEGAEQDRERAERLAQSTRATLRGQAEGEYLEIVEQLKTSENAYKDAKDALERTERRVTQCEFAIQNAEGAIKTQEATAEQARKRSREAAENTLHDPEYLAQRWDALIAEHSSNYPAMRSVCDQQVKSRSEESVRVGNTASSAAATFAQSFGEHASTVIDGGWGTGLPWIQGIVRRLENTDLPESKGQLIEAELVAQETFRRDVAVRLRENIVALGVHQQKLNDALKRCPTFSNGERYHFMRTLRPQFKALYEFVEKVAEHGADGDLFGNPGEIPEEFRAILDEKTALGGGDKRTPLDDYREFFEFDIEIRREDIDGSGSKKVGTLSKRIGPGSGGEHSAPLYVIAGAALASAYNLDAKADSGMHLILLDEAFDRMDSRNIAATMQFFEQLGLQVFLACPTDKRPLLTAFIDRYYTIARDADVNTIFVQRTDVNPAARTIARADMPEFHPELIEAETQRVRAERLAPKTP